MTHRRVFAAILALVVALGLVACGSDSSSDSDEKSSGPKGPWTFIDDRGEGIDLDSVPKRIVAQEDAAAALMQFGIKPVGVFGGAAIDESPIFEGLDTTGIESVGSVYGEINIEKLASLRPDLIVTHLYPGAPPLWGFKDEKQEKQVGEIAPIVALDATLPATDSIARVEELAGTLGVNLESPALRADRRRLDNAIKDLRAAVAENPGVSVVGMSGTQENLLVAQPDDYQDLEEYRRLGVELVVPKTADAYWEQLSWEQAGKYPADVILYDVRPYSLPLGQVEKIPTWNRLPAVEAGQVGQWHLGMSTGYDRLAQHVEELTELIRGARADVAS